jgi:hypothetical protein
MYKLQKMYHTFAVVAYIANDNIASSNNIIKQMKNKQVIVIMMVQLLEQNCVVLTSPAEWLWKVKMYSREYNRSLRWDMFEHLCLILSEILLL